MNADGSDVRMIVEPPANEQSPSWSPDGRRIVFASGRHGNGIYVVDADGTDLRQRTDGSRPTWFDPAALAISPADKQATLWGWIKIRRE